MIILTTLSLLVSNSVSLRRDMGILYNRIAIIGIIYSLMQSLVNYTIISKSGIGLHGGLFHITSITEVFHIFIYLICILILTITSFYPNEYTEVLTTSTYLKGKTESEDGEEVTTSDISRNYEIGGIISNMGEHLKIIEFPLIILFIVSGALFLMSTHDFISIFLSIELQSYGLYLLSTIYRNSEMSTSGGLTYFLLGALSSCFILLGSALLYTNSGTTNLDSLYVITSISDINNSNLVGVENS